MQCRHTSVALVVLAVSGLTSPTHAQPGTDIFVASLSEPAGRITVGPLTNATDRDGYDNQPQFGLGGAYVLYTSARPDGQTDIYRYDIASDTTNRVTQTAESEYSPTIMPGAATFSVIRVEADSAQRLWQFDLNGRNPRLIFESIMPVGYHAWGSDYLVGMFVLGSPATLQLGDTRTGQAKVIEANIGRSIHRIPGEHAISFVHKASDEVWWIRRLDLGSEEVTPLIRTLSGSEDYAWTPGGTILMGRNSILYSWRRGAEDWAVVADFANQGIKTITRIAVSPAGDRIAIVGDRG